MFNTAITKIIVNKNISICFILLSSLDFLKVSIHEFYVVKTANDQQPAV